MLAAAEQAAKVEAELKLKEGQRVAGIVYRMKVKELTELCKIKMAGTTFDKFWVESIVKRFSTIDKIAPICAFLEASESQDDFVEYMTSQTMSEADRAKVASQKRDEQANPAESLWNDEELAMLA